MGTEGAYNLELVAMPPGTADRPAGHQPQPGATMAALPLVRDREPLLAALRERCERARAGHSSVVIVEGGAGFGKTHVLQAAAALAEELGLRTGYGSAADGDNAVPMSPIFAALFDGRRPLVNPGERGKLHYLPEQRYWLLEEIESLVEQAAVEYPLLIAIDDVQWADNGSLLALRTLPARLSSLPIVWLISIRSTAAPPEVLTLADRLVDDGGLHVRLSPLGEAAVAEVVSDLVGAVPGPELLALARRAGGSPFLLTELIRGLREESLIRIDAGQAVLIEDRLPARVGDSMRARLGRMPELTRRVAQAAAVLGRSFTFEQLAAMTGEPAMALLAPVEELRAADLLADGDGRLGFGHDLIREAVRGTLPATALRALQRQAVDTLLTAGALPVEIATQLADSAEPGDDAAVETLHQAARTLAVSAPDAAADLSRRALELASPRYPERVALVAETALRLHAAGRVGEGKEFADNVLRQALTSEQEAEVLLSIANMYGLSADQRADADVRALALPGLPELTRARHLAYLAHNRTTGGRSADAAALVPTVREAVERTGDVASRCTLELVESGLHYLAGDYAAARDRVEASVRTGTGLADPSRMVLVQYWRSEVYSVLDRYDEALQRTAANLARALHDHQVWGSFLFEGCRGRHLMQLGRLDDACASLDPAVEMAEHESLAGVLDTAAAVARGQIAIRTGDAAWLRRCLTYTESLRGAGTPAVQRHAAWLSAVAAMAEGNATRARDDAATLLSGDRSRLEPRLPHDVTDEIELMRIALAAGDRLLAEVAMASASQRRVLNPGVASVAGAAAHCRGLRDESAADLDEAIEAFAAGPRPLALASALEDAGLLAARQDAADRAVTMLTRALKAYADLGASWDAARVRGQLRRLGVRRRLATTTRPLHGWAGLTESELNVVRLVARGLTNREAAERLYLSVHTVSSHLRSAFTKLGINSRVELANVAADAERPGAADVPGGHP
jgi:DNA-binding CsgD family transcriptional regulator